MFRRQFGWVVWLWLAGCATVPPAVNETLSRDVDVDRALLHPSSTTSTALQASFLAETLVMETEPSVDIRRLEE